MSAERKWSGAGRKRVNGSGAVSGHSRKHLSGSGAWSGRPRSRSGAGITKIGLSAERQIVPARSPHMLFLTSWWQARGFLASSRHEEWNWPYPVSTHTVTGYKVELDTFDFVDGRQKSKCRIRLCRSLHVYGIKVSNILCYYEYFVLPFKWPQTLQAPWAVMSSLLLTLIWYCLPFSARLQFFMLYML